MCSGERAMFSVLTLKQAHLGALLSRATSEETVLKMPSIIASFAASALCGNGKYWQLKHVTHSLMLYVGRTVCTSHVSEYI